MTRGDWLVATLLVFGAAVTIVLGAMRHRVATAALAAVAVLALLWVLAGAATATGWRDADGWVDCYPRCTLLQDATGIVLAFGPALAALLLAVAAAAAIVGRRNRGHAR